MSHFRDGGSVLPHHPRLDLPQHELRSCKDAKANKPLQTLERSVHFGCSKVGAARNSSKNELALHACGYLQCTQGTDVLHVTAVWYLLQLIYDMNYGT